MTRREHIEALAADMGVALLYSVPRYMMAANLGGRFVLMNDWDEVPEDEVYWVALHELGHIATTPMPDEQRDEDELEYEALAWVWALEQSRFPLATAGQSSIAWGIADYMRLNELKPSPALRRIVDALGPEPDWYMNVTTPEHWAKLDGWARPNWARLVAAVADLEAPAASPALGAGLDLLGEAEELQDLLVQ